MMNWFKKQFSLTEQGAKNLQKASLYCFLTYCINMGPVMLLLYLAKLLLENADRKAFTPWELIQERAELAAKGDFVTVLYNPRSHKRVGQIQAVQEIFLRERAPETPVGIVTSASREGENVVISTLGAFTKEDINMFSIVIIGNSKTKQNGQWMITPRGYQKREPGL